MRDKRFLVFTFVSTSLLISIFLFLRLYRLSSSLDFMADMGRDHYILWQWKALHKFPLLGPSNSILPINQSPVYYYLLYPAFLLTRESAYASVVSVLWVCLSVFVAGVYLCMKKKWIVRIVIAYATLSTFQPEFVAQLRSPWNPSFVVPFLSIGVLCLLLPMQESNRKRIFIFCLSLLAALGFSYSVLPVVLLLGVAAFVTWKRYLRTLFISGIGASLLIFGPMLLFEVRHGFFFTKRLLLDHTLASQGSVHFIENMREIFFIFLGVRNGMLAFFVGLFVLVNLIWSLLRKEKSAIVVFHDTVGLLLLASVIITCLVPFSIIPHYALGILVLLLLFIASMEKTWLIPIAAILFFTWIKPIVAGDYWKPARRTIADLEQCAQLVCSGEKSPMYVALQAWYPYHYAPDYLFLFNKHGCSAFDITTDGGRAKTLAIVADQATFELGKTAFNELSLFGPASLRKTYQCNATIHVYMLDPAKL